ncbi:MAG TPA: hypothetical protein VMV94_08565 [Phycisphaerae bacterium]|nr:hypothetical protein [Phycisphaerae bacterium]
MPDFTPHQKKIIDRYYEHRDQIMLDKLSQLVSELYLADSDKKRDQLWKRVATALKNLKIDESLRAHILQKRSPEVLAANLRDWIK